MDYERWKNGFMQKTECTFENKTAPLEDFFFFQYLNNC